jgi:hypothetical protein
MFGSEQTSHKGFFNYLSLKMLGLGQVGNHERF